MDVLQLSALPIVQLRRLAEPGPGGKPLLNHLMPSYVDDQPDEVPLLPVWIDNWRRLGLIDVDYTMLLVGDKAYEWVEQRPEFLRLVEQDARGADSIEIRRGRVRPTDFGERFLQAVTIGSGQNRFRIEAATRLVRPPRTGVLPVTAAGASGGGCQGRVAAQRTLDGGRRRRCGDGGGATYSAAVEPAISFIGNLAS